MTRALLPVVFVAACGGGSSSVPAGQRVGVAVGAALSAADVHRAPWRCAAPDGPNLVDETVGSWKLAAHTLHRDGGEDLTIATIADAGGAAPATIAALGRIKPKLAKADLVLALGGMGTTAAELEATLGALADKAPLVVLPGDLEGIGALTTAIKSLRAKGHLVIDGRLAQRIELPGATLAVVAGTGAASRAIAGADGCTYRAADVPAAFADLTARTRLRILATAEAPRGTSGGEAVGELALTPGAGTEIDIVLHGPVDGAVSRARTGGRDADAIALTPGTSDATPRLPGPVRTPTAGLLSIHGTTWTWKPLADAE
ncbi:hypothetical protein BH11MYX3_BH11MYX3_25730 [soil metagenome]